MAPNNKVCESEATEALRKLSIQSTGTSVSFEDNCDRYRHKAESKVQELISTEISYVQNLREIVEGYLKYMEDSLDIPKPDGLIQMPADLRNRNKYRIIFGNIRDIFDYHQRTILPELERCKNDMSVLLELFSTRKDSLKMKYGRFCLNKPKSEYIIAEHQDYFSLIRMSKDFKHHLNSQLMTPVQRVTRYPLLLKEICNLYRKAEDESNQEIVSEAYNIVNEVADYANNMMTAGRISGFWGDVTRQGLLLMCGDVICTKRRHALKKPKMRCCLLFVFQESIIVCEKDDNLHMGISSASFRPQLTYWTSFQINKVHVREVNRGPDFTPRFELERRNDGRREVHRPDEPTKSPKSEVDWIVVQCESEQMRDKWLKVINDQIKELQTLALNISNPKHT